LAKFGFVVFQKLEHRVFRALDDFLNRGLAFFVREVLA
jgi:hypothetical protein